MSTPVPIGITSINDATVLNLGIGDESEVGIAKTKNSWTPFLATFQDNQRACNIIDTVSMLTPRNVEVCVLKKSLTVSHRHQVAEVQNHVHDKRLTNCTS
jgi:hypothetical protein